MAIVPWVVLLALVTAAGLTIHDVGARLVALRLVLASAAAAEGTAGITYVFRGRYMAERSGRPYAAAYHGLMQDFGFYNLALALLFALAALDPTRNLLVIRIGMALYAVHGGTHVLRSLGLYYGGEARVPSRAAALEVRDALQLLVALTGMALFLGAATR